VKVDEKGVRREPIGTVAAMCDAQVWRNMELQAKADGWTDLMWRCVGTYNTLYGRPRPAWLLDGEQVIFTTMKGKYSAEMLQSRHDAVDKAVYAGWVALRWVDDRDGGLNHLVGRKMSHELVDHYPVRDRDGLPIIRSELGGLMGPGYQATGYEPPPRRQVLLDDPTGDDIAGDAP